ncbi:arylamine N-acetyltransferase [Streptomyces sp. NPDC058678]|uniref:arylamine N-acetyltransferase family protein n=1 Tax=Streptomyces sp. NPDC058678 TaxID=3346595 RepID=UPI00365FE706
MLTDQAVSDGTEVRASDPSGGPTGQWDATSLRLDAYLRRIGYDGPRTPTAAVLAAVHRAHMTAIAFENLDVALGREISLDLDDLQGKLVDRGRGGYCFEHNLLLAAALTRLGFTVTRYLARVRRGRRQIRYRAHAVLVVTIGDQQYLADAGFGDEGLVEPLPLAAGAVAEAGEWKWRIHAEGPDWVLQSLHQDGWFDLYAFRPELHHLVDFEVANYYTAHSPRSTFTGKVIAMRGNDRSRHLLRDREMSVVLPDGSGETRELTGAQVVVALRDVFGIRLTPEDQDMIRLRFPSA